MSRLCGVPYSGMGKTQGDLGMYSCAKCGNSNKEIL